MLVGVKLPEMPEIPLNCQKGGVYQACWSQTTRHVGLSVGQEFELGGV